MCERLRDGGLGGIDRAPERRDIFAQALGALAVLVYSFVVTSIIGWVLHKTIGFTVREDDEVNGIDLLEHAETAYELSSFGGGGSGRSVLAARTAPLEPSDAAPAAAAKEGASA